MARKRNRLNPDLIHQHQAKLAGLRSDLILKVGSTYKLDTTSGVQTPDFNKLSNLMKHYNNERKELLAQYKTLYDPLPQLFPFSSCCHRVTPSDNFYTKYLDPDAFKIYGQAGTASANQAGTGKKAYGYAGDAQLAGAMAVPLSSVSFGFRTSFALNDEYNAVTVRSGVSVDIGWFEALTFSALCFSSLSVNHHVMVSVGMSSGNNNRVVFSHHCYQIGGGLGPTFNSELIYQFVRTGAGETVVVDECIVLAANRQGPDLTKCEATVSASPIFMPLHIAVNTSP